MTFNNRIKQELRSHEKNNFDFDIGELLAIKNYIASCNTNPKRSYINRRFEALYKKNYDVINKTRLLDNLSIRDVINIKNDKLDLAKGFLAGKFTCNGVFSGLDKNHNLELFNSEICDAENLNKILALFGIESNMITRKKYFVSYIRDAESIADFLKIIGANNSFTEFENIRILKSIRNNINRGVNFETANINKTVAASVNQINNINYIVNSVGMNYLDNDLKEIALYRLKYKQASLNELCEKFEPRISKSGLHYKLKLINQIADRLKNKRDDKK